MVPQGAAMAPTTMSSDGVQMYIKQSAGGSASSPSYASYAPSIRQPPRSESFESLLELSVLASDLLEGGHTDLESEQEHSAEPGSTGRGPLTLSTPPNHSSQTFVNSLPAYTNGNGHAHGHGHRRNESTWTTASSSLNSTSRDTAGGYSTQPSEVGDEPEVLALASSFTTFGEKGKGRADPDPAVIGIRAGESRFGNGSASELMQRDLSSTTQTQGLYAHAGSFFGNGNGTTGDQGQGLRTTRTGSIAQTVESFATAPTHANGHSTPLDLGQLSPPLDLQLQLRAPGDDEHAAVASTSASGTSAQSPRSPRPAGMKISQWLREQYDSGVRAPDSGPAPAPARAPAPAPSPKADPNAPFGSLLRTPNSPGAQHREKLLTEIIANDMREGAGEGPSTAELEQLPWHPNEHVSPVRAAGGLKRNRSTGSAFMLLNRSSADAAAGAGAGQKRNSRLSGLSGLKIDTSALLPKRNNSHQRTLSADNGNGLSRFTFGSLRGPVMGPASAPPVRSETTHRPPEMTTPPPGLHAYEQQQPRSQSPYLGSSASAAGQCPAPGPGGDDSLAGWKRMKGWGRASMNDLLLKRGDEPRPFSPTTAPAPPAAPAPASYAYEYEDSPIRRHKRSISGMASSLFSRDGPPSPRAPVRWTSLRGRTSTQSPSGTLSPSPVRKPPMHARTVSEPFADSPTIVTALRRVRVPLFPSTANSSTSSVHEVQHGHSRPASPLSRANHAAYFEGWDQQQQQQFEAFPSRLGASGAGGPKLSDLASQQVARDAELRSRLVSKFRPAPPPVPEELALDEARSPVLELHL